MVVVISYPPIHYFKVTKMDNEQTILLEILNGRCDEDYDSNHDEFRMYSISLWGFD